MGTVLGGIVDRALVGAVRLLEMILPMPPRLGIPLSFAQRVRSGGGDPVILVGGFANAPTVFSEWQRSLAADGFDVQTFDLPSRGLGDMRESACLLAAFIEQVKRRTGRARVDVIGFSEGGILARMVVAMGRANGSVDRIISLASPHGGVFAADAARAVALLSLMGTALPLAVRQLTTGSELLAQLRQADASLRSPTDAERGARYVSLFSRVDDLIVSPISGVLDGALNVPIRHDDLARSGGPNHWGMVHLSNRAYMAARAALLDADPTEVVVAGYGPIASRPDQG